MSDTPAVETEGVTRRYGDTVAVRELDLRVERGEVFGFLGPNGAGKSTTIDLLVGFARPDAGSVRVFGRDPLASPVAVRERVGVLPDDRGVYPNLTGREQLASAVDVAGTDDDPERLLDRVGLAPAARDRPAGDYSTGMRGRLLLAIVLVGDPELLILDEPSLGLDPGGVREVRALLEERAAAGTAVFLSSHRLGEVEAVCDRVGILADGRLRAVAPVDELRERLRAGERLQVTTDDRPTNETLSELSTVGGVVDVTRWDDATQSDDSVRSDGVVRSDDPTVGATEHDDGGTRTGSDENRGTRPAPPDDGPPTVTVTCADPATKATVVRRLDRAVGVADFRRGEPSLERVFEAFVDGTAGADTDVHNTDRNGTDADDNDRNDTIVDDADGDTTDGHHTVDQTTGGDSR